MKIAFLDRDGTINKDYSDELWKDREEPEFLEGAIEGLKKLIDLEYEIIIVTNQYIINDGIISLDNYNNFTRNLMARFNAENIKILDVFYCPHSIIENCKCRKPNQGMILDAIEKHQNIQMDKSILIGDSICDQTLAKEFDIRFFGILGNDFKDIEKDYISILEIANSIENKTN